MAQKSTQLLLNVFAKSAAFHGAATEEFKLFS
jgi:hypothetical protein